MSSPSLTWTLPHLTTFRTIRWTFFSLSLVLSLFSYHVVSFSTCFSKLLWERTAAASVSMTILSPILFLQSFASIQEGEMCKDEEFQRKSQLLCFTPVHSAGISYRKLLSVAFFSIKMSCTILHKVSFHFPSHTLLTDWTEITVHGKTDPVWSPCPVALLRRTQKPLRPFISIPNSYWRF